MSTRQIKCELKTGYCNNNKVSHYWIGKQRKINTACRRCVEGWRRWGVKITPLERKIKDVKVRR